MKKTTKKGSPIRRVFKGLLSRFGDEIIHLFDGSYKRKPIEVIDTGVTSLNWVLGRGGLPRGRIVVLYGPESSGKSTVCLKFVAAAQSRGMSCAFVDLEGTTLDIDYMHQCGVDETKNFVLAQPDYGEQAFDIVEDLIGKVDIIIVDSVAMLIPKSEADADITDQFIGLHARMMSREMRRITPRMKGAKTSLVFTNQIRDKIGGFGFGPQETMPGGHALRHSASVMLTTRRTKPIQNGSQQVGFMIKVKAVKNKVGNPFRTLEIPMIFGYGIDDRLDFVSLALKCGIVKKKKSLYYLGNRVLGSGWLKVYQKIAGGERLRHLVESRITAYLDKQTLKEMSGGQDEKWRKKKGEDDEES